MAAVICSCGKPVETKPEWAGQWISCPGCGGTLYAPYPGPKPAAPLPEPRPADARPETRLCAWCAETVPVADLKCGYCGGNPAFAPQRVPPLRVPVRVSRLDDGGTGTLIMGILGIAICNLLAPVAWAMGASYVADCRAKGLEPSGAGKTGRILGIIGTVLILAALALFFLKAVSRCH